MGAPATPDPVRMFLAVTWHPSAPVDRALAQVRAELGDFGWSHGPVPFSFTDYYEEEMGMGLLKSYHLFDRTADRAILADVKVRTNAIEREYARDGKRIMNLDPGYLARDKLVLASTKDFYHRLYLGKGIFGEVTLHFRKGVFRHFSWTYADYQEPGVIDILTRGRASLVGGIRRGE